jgi:hypothetical protein
MTPATSRLLLALGASLLAAWLVAPVSSSPPPQAGAMVTSEAMVPLAALPELDALNGEVDRLRDRLAEPARASEPVRDPFQYAAVPIERVVALRALDPLDADSFEPQRPSIVWPSLVAILSSGTDELITRQAVLGIGYDLLEIRSVGEVLGGIVVSDITSDAVTLTHALSGQSTHLALR